MVHDNHDNFEDKTNTRSDEAITRRIGAAREAARLTKTEFAGRLGLSKQAYNPYEKGDTPFTVQQLFRAADVLNLPITHFLGVDTGLSIEEEQLLELYRKGDAQGLGPTILRVTRALAGE